MYSITYKLKNKQKQQQRKLPRPALSTIYFNDKVIKETKESVLCVASLVLNEVITVLDTKIINWRSLA